MNLMISRKSKPVVVSLADAALAKLDERMKTLAKQDEALREADKSMEHSGGRSSITEDAKAVLAGGDFDPTANPLSQREFVQKKRAVISRAMQLGNSERERLLIERAATVWSEFFEEIAELERRRLLAALTVQKLNREREELRERIRLAGGGLYLPGDGFEMLGIGERADDEPLVLGDRLVGTGVMTPAEWEHAKRG
jgi:hypothetical protein